MTSVFNIINLILLLFNLYCVIDRWGGEKSSEVYSYWHCGLIAHLFPGILCCFCCPHPNDALLPAGWKKPPAHGLWIHRMGSGQICSGCGITMCSVHQVWNGLDPVEWQIRIQQHKKHWTISNGLEMLINSLTLNGGAVNHCSWPVVMMYDEWSQQLKARGFPGRWNPSVPHFELTLCSYPTCITVPANQTVVRTAHPPPIVKVAVFLVSQSFKFSFCQKIQNH